MCSARVRGSVPESRGSTGEVSRRAISRWEKLTCLSANFKNKATSSVETLHNRYSPQSLLSTNSPQTLLSRREAAGPVLWFFVDYIKVTITFSGVQFR